VLDDMDSREEVEYIRWILEHGTGADRQLAAWEASGRDLQAVVNYMILETSQGTVIAAMTTNELQPGAANAIRVCLNVQPNERVTVITDDACREISEAPSSKEIEAVGAAYAVLRPGRRGDRGRCPRSRAASPRTWKRATSASLRRRCRPTSCDPAWT
jgi:hypothetical protein